MHVPAYPDWHAALADAVTDPVELCRLLALPEGLAAEAQGPHAQFPLLVPRTFLARIRPGDCEDPLLLQVLPRPEELRDHAHFVADPLGEATATESSGLLQKYPSRLLIVATGLCAVHCRFCFRRHFPYCLGPKKQEHWEQLVQRIAARTDCDEVILSGGDPLALDDGLWADFARRLASISHLRRLRIHTRLPILIPQRVNGQLIAWLRGTRLAPWVVVHINHPAEVDDLVAGALARLVDAGIPVLSQSVLLRGVNDRADVLAALFRHLVDLRVQPYYLHQLDRVAGAAHFEVSEDVGAELVAALRAVLPGYAVPRLVREVPTVPHKVVVA